jgi:hypothetical protein
MFISPVFHTMWVTFKSACQIRSEIGPQFESSLSTAVLADFSFRDLWLSH